MTEAQPVWMSGQTTFCQKDEKKRNLEIQRARCRAIVSDDMMERAEVRGLRHSQDAMSAARN